MCDTQTIHHRTITREKKKKKNDVAEILRRAHDDAAPAALGHVVRQQGCFEVVEAKAAFFPVVPPVAVVVAV